MQSRGFSLGVRRFVAGERLEDALAVRTRLQEQGFLVVLDLLGEFLDTRDGVTDMVNQVLFTVDALGAAAGDDRQLSVKPTQLGLGIDYGLALGNTRAVTLRARAAGVHVCLDMENHPYTDGTLQLLRDLHGEGLHNLSTVLQAALHRTPADLARLHDTSAAGLRIVKGAYREPDSVALQDPARIRAAFIELVRQGMAQGRQLNIATHDERLIAVCRQLLSGYPQHEFQLLYGVKPRLQQKLLDDGARVRIYLPYGSDWYGYFSRRLAERPANLGLVLRGLTG